MNKSNIVDFPLKTCAIGEESALWVIIVSPGVKEAYSCEYAQEIERWKLNVHSSTFQGAAALMEKCRHIMGWGGGKEARRSENHV